MKISAGDVFLLGRHRLMCGDSTRDEDVINLMNGEKADLVFTDPPYGVRYMSEKGKTVVNDRSAVAIPFSFDICVKHAALPDAHFYWCGGMDNVYMYQRLFEKYLSGSARIIVWVKNGMVLRHVGYHSQYELIFYGCRPGCSKRWFGSRKMADASDVWQVARPANSQYIHPTQKPVGLPARAIRNHCPAGGVVYDGFGGSGSTLIAAEEEGRGRRCLMMEIEPDYCAAIIGRYEKATGQTAIRWEKRA